MSFLPESAGNSLYGLLQYYIAATEAAPDTHSDNWLAATVLTKYQSSYRQPGALLLISPLGKVHGLVSGSCLEQDVVLRAQKVRAFGRPEFVIYDSTDADNIAAELGLGCKGRVGILIQELTPAHRTLLAHLHARLQAGHSAYMLYCCASPAPADLAPLVLLDDQLQVIISSDPQAPLPALPPAPDRISAVIDAPPRRWVLLRYRPPIHAWVIGGGVDAKPLVSIAAMLGWRLSVIDHRPSRGRAQDFPAAEQIVRSTPETFFPGQPAQAVFVMTHNQSLDARWLRRLSQPDLSDCMPGYIGLLGPPTRKAEVVAAAGLTADADFARAISGPMGFNIGGDLPESVAISAIAECHQRLAGLGYL